MALRPEHNKVRPPPPRLKDLRPGVRTVERNRNQDAKGRFTAGNDAPRAGR